MKEFTDTELANERWRDVDGYDGAYQVSDLGRVRSKKYGRWKVLKQGRQRDGYLTVLLSKNGKRKTSKVHRLVAQAFIPNDDESKTIINHIDENKHNNQVSNLEWCDYKYNSTYNDIHHRRIINYNHPNYKYHKIKDLYRPYLSIKQNIALFKEQGINCSHDLIWRLRKDLGLTNNKRDKLKDLYNPDLTIKQNIEVFKAKGIECSRDTVWKIRKDLGLIK